MDARYRILIVEDHPITAHAYKNILEIFQKSNQQTQFVIEIALTIEAAIKKLDKGAAYNLVLLDINLPRSTQKKIKTGEALGTYLRDKVPAIKIMVITMLSDMQRVTQIFKLVNPDGFLVKTDIEQKTLLEAVLKIYNGGMYYSKSIIGSLRKNIARHEVLDDIDLKILKELANGAKMRDLISLLHLTKSGIERRKRKLKSIFEIETNNDRDLVLKARAKGFI